MHEHVPCWRLPQVQEMLREKGVLERMRTAPGYLSVLTAAAGREAQPA